MKSVFNIDKSDYESPSLFLGEGGNGVLDSINKKYPEIWKRYKSIKSLDWDENEFNYSSCINDFKSCDKSTYDMMIKTLAFQWEADSIASRISPIVGCVVTSSELWAAWQRVSDQEVIHALTYSEIVRNSFEDPSDILNEIIKVKESFSRLNVIGQTLDKVSKYAHEYAAGLRPNDQEMYNQCYLFTVAMLILERVQFGASFGVTFAICDTGLFTPIGKAVQKIAQDEFEEHVELDKAVLRNEWKTERGAIAKEQCKDLVKQMLDEVVESELEWVDYLFSEGRSLVGINADLLKKWSMYGASDVYSFMEIEPERKLPKQNPLNFMEKWLNISMQQSSLQEEDQGQYRVGIVRRDDEETIFEDDF